MKKTLILMLMLSMVISVACAEELTNRFSIGLVTGGVIPKDKNIDNSWYIGGNCAYGFNEYLALGLETGYTKWNDEESGVEYGDVTAVPLLADLYVRYPIKMGDKTLVPYAIGGIGVVFWNYEESSLLKDNGISVNMDPELGIKLGGGFDYFISKNMALNLEGSYLWSDADMTVAAFGSTAAATIDTDAWFVTGGVKYYF